MYIVYLTENLKSSRYLVGIHETDNLNFDYYLGDGVYINQACTFMYPKTPFQCAVKKFGVNQFRRLTLGIYDSFKDALNFMRTFNLKEPQYYNTSYLPSDDKIYQYNLNGELTKVWNNSIDVCDFYGYPKQRFDIAITHKHIFLNSIWSYKNKVNPKEYIKYNPRITHIYKDNKLIFSFAGEKDCEKFYKVQNITEHIKNNTPFVAGLYASYSVTDEYIPNIRKSLKNVTFYVYKADGFIGSYKGKKVMPVIGLHSWTKINNALKLNNGWYKDFYLSTSKVDKVPDRKVKYRIDIYTKEGNFIESMDSIALVKQKYNVPSCKIKNIQQGNRYYGDYIFKYNK